MPGCDFREIERLKSEIGSDFDPNEFLQQQTPDYNIESIWEEPDPKNLVFGSEGKFLNTGFDLGGLNIKPIKVFGYSTAGLFGLSLLGSGAVNIGKILGHSDAYAFELAKDQEYVIDRAKIQGDLERGEIVPDPHVLYTLVVNLGDTTDTRENFISMIGTGLGNQLDVHGFSPQKIWEATKEFNEGKGIGVDTVFERGGFVNVICLDQLGLILDEISSEKIRGLEKYQKGLGARIDYLQQRLPGRPEKSAAVKKRGDLLYLANVGLTYGFDKSSFNNGVSSEDNEAKISGRTLLRLGNVNLGKIGKTSVYLDLSGNLVTTFGDGRYDFKGGSRIGKYHTSEFGSQALLGSGEFGPRLRGGLGFSSQKLSVDFDHENVNDLMQTKNILELIAQLGYVSDGIKFGGGVIAEPYVIVSGDKGSGIDFKFPVYYGRVEDSDHLYCFSIVPELGFKQIDPNDFGSKIKTTDYGVDAEVGFGCCGKTAITGGWKRTDTEGGIYKSDSDVFRIGVKFKW
jgi:hypothetical protein